MHIYTVLTGCLWHLLGTEIHVYTTDCTDITLVIFTGFHVTVQSQLLHKGKFTTWAIASLSHLGSHNSETDYIATITRLLACCLQYIIHVCIYDLVT